MVEKAKKSKASKDQTATDINFKFKSIRTSCSEVIDFTGNKHYRTVFRLNEVETLFVDTEVINKQFDEKAWDAEIVAALIYMHGEQPVLVAQKGGKVILYHLPRQLQGQGHQKCSAGGHGTDGERCGRAYSSDHYAGRRKW